MAANAWHNGGARLTSASSAPGTPAQRSIIATPSAISPSTPAVPSHTLYTHASTAVLRHRVECELSSLVRAAPCGCGRAGARHRHASQRASYYMYM